jgi:tungstate transport system ATP-binding protein
MEPLYRLEGILKEFDGRQVVDIDSLEIYPGEILALVGPSGAGKSTLLRLLNFLEVPNRGTLVYRGHRADSGLPLDLRREVTTVFQRPVLLSTSVRENVAFGLKLRGVSPNGAVAGLLARVGLHALEQASARKLSGGEMQRVALARALAIRPRVLLLDEPTANLDPYNVGLIEEIVREQHREEKTTIVLVTHNVFQARRLATRAGLLLNGRIVELADTGTFFESPRDPRTGAFVRGEMVY